MKKWWFRSYLLLAIIECAVFLSFQLDRSRILDSYKTIFSSFNRLSLISVTIILVGIIAVLIVDLFGPSLRNWLSDLLKAEPFFWGILILFSLLLIESGQNLLFLRADLPEDFFPFFLVENIAIVQLSGLISLQTIILLILFRLRPDEFRRNEGGKKHWLIGIGLVILVVIILAFTGTGFNPRSVSRNINIGTFDTTNAPLPMVQVIIIWLVVTLVWWLVNRFIPDKKTGLRKFLNIAIIWAVAMMVWSSVPITPNYFIDEISEPTNQHNPLSDSIYYETQAHRLLSGEGFFEKVQHPLYGYILSGLHLVGGDHYEDIYLLQIAILAIMPVLVFKLTSLMLSPFAGWLTSFLFIAREYNALILGDSITITNVMYLMTESITQLGVILFVYLMVVWLTMSDRSSKGMPFLLGSVIGLLALVRVEMLSLIIVFFIICLIKYWHSWKKWFWGSVALISVVLVITVPWMFRNWQVTGSFYLDKGEFFSREILAFLNPAEDVVKDSISPTSIATDPDQVTYSRVEKISMHFRSSLSESFLYLPSNHQPLAGIDNYLNINFDKGRISLEKGGVFSEKFLTGYIKTLDYWDMNWDGRISNWTLLPLGIVLSLIGAGFLMVWKRNRLMALTPLLVLIMHFLTYAVFSRSGGRFIQTIDWITLIYFCIGLAAAGAGLSKVLGLGSLRALVMDSDPIAPLDSNIVSKEPGNHWKIILAGGIFILIGISMPIVEAGVPPRYTIENLTQRLEDIQPTLLIDNDHPQNPVGGESGWLYGKAIYPGFYQAGEELLDNRGGRAPDPSLSRLDFYLIGMEIIWVSIPLDAAPEYFPHGSEVIIQGVITRDSTAHLEEGLRPYLLAERVLIVQEGEENYVLIEASGLSEGSLD